MNKTIITAMVSLFAFTANAQKGITGLIKAEKDFAAYSVAHSTKEAFLQFIDSNSIMFDEGKPITAIEFWNKREKRPGVLNWHPQFSEIAASGDFGWTTGPWTFQNSLRDSVIARGQYATVWALNKKGEWKFVVDFGIDNTQPGDPGERIIATPKEQNGKGDHSPSGMLEKAEMDFNSLAEKDRAKAYSTYLSAEGILLRNGYLPAVTNPARRTIIDSTPAGIKYTSNGWGIAGSGDMGYTYGSTTVKEKPVNYFRIWRREKTGWKVALEVFRY